MSSYQFALAITDYVGLKNPDYEVKNNANQNIVKIRKIEFLKIRKIFSRMLLSHDKVNLLFWRV